MRIFIGLVEAAGRNRALKWGFEELGHRTTFINLTPGTFDYGGDDSSHLCRLIRSLGSLRRELSPGIARGCLAVPELFARLVLFLRVLFANDVFIYSSATSFFRFWDYRLIRLLGKKLICQFHGSDSRPPYLNGAYTSRRDFSVEACVRDTAAQKRRLQAVGRWATALIDIPPQGYFHERPYFLCLYAGLPSGPFGTGLDAPMAAPAAERPAVRIVHAPSSERYKGTELIRAMIGRLESKGYNLEFVEIKNKTPHEVMGEIRGADLVVDQLYCDYALNSLPSEALWCGKPVLSGGYSAGLWAELVPAEFLPPVVYCHPSEFEDRLERLVSDAGLRQRLGKEGHDYVRRLHDPKVVASNYLRIANGHAPAQWLYDPAQMRTIWGGFFMSEDQAKNVTRQVIHRYGRSGLQLSDKPNLEREVVEWALRK